MGFKNVNDALLKQVKQAYKTELKSLDMTGRRPSPPPYLTLQENLYTFLRLAYISLYFLAALRQQTGSGAGCLKRSSPPSVKQAVMNTGPEEQVDVEGQANGNKG